MPERGMAKRCKAMIVHPRFVHTLRAAPVSGRRVRFGELPPDALRMLAAELSEELADVLRFEQVSKPCRDAVGNELLWKRMCLNTFSVPEGTRPNSWRELYRFNHEFLHTVLLYATDRLMAARLQGLTPGMVLNMGMAV
uniref:F-box domain-containing protein n=1 Tax=Chlamydomonas euryale TaxID=1486919 RepID=A0A7R9Z933_9CHLO|mmetsp:Transcript_981/g.2635  ORF Transcript_981/g.2635 Transcript_981/m.2635 type:complete len:139 (+) Transcript_981:200-616(+)